MKYLSVWIILISMTGVTCAQTPPVEPPDPTPPHNTLAQKKVHPRVTVTFIPP